MRIGTWMNALVVAAAASALCGAFQEGSSRRPPPRDRSARDVGADQRPPSIELDEGEDKEAAFEAELALLEEEYFLTCDRNGNGWISYREARASLSIDRDEYALYDADRDGRIDRAEFGRRYWSTIEAVGGFRPPVPARSMAPTDKSWPLAYDYNASGSLETGEVQRFLDDQGLGLGAEAVIRQLDANGSGALEPAEITTITEDLARIVDVPPVEGMEPAGPATLEDLFGGLKERETRFGPSQLPPRIIGPVTHFRRLDFDNDGAIEASDLMDLLTPARVDVRASAVIAALDRDGDGRLSESEFVRSLQR